MSDEMALVPVAGSAAGFKPDNVIHGLKGTYTVLKIDGKPLLSTPQWNLYVAQLPTGQFGFMKIATKPEYNESLQKETHILETLLQLANEADADIEPGKQRFNYGAFFPNVVESMLSNEPAPRFTVFFGFHESIKSYKEFTPATVAFKSNRVDLQTTVWILAKSLKFLDFCHRYGFTVGAVEMSNLLLETSLHGTFYFDFSRANEAPEDSDYLSEVAAAAVLAWKAAGGTEMVPPPHDVTIMSKDNYDRYLALLKRIIEHPQMADVEQDALYALSDEIWPKVAAVGGPADFRKRQWHEWVVFPKSL